jgi:hypothetical protein
VPDLQRFNTHLQLPRSGFVVRLRAHAVSGGKVPARSHAWGL